LFQEHHLALICLEVLLISDQEFEKLPDIIKAAAKVIEPTVLKDIVEVLRDGPVAPSAISSVIFSHLHFDHVGDCTLFPDADMIAGPGSKAASAPGWPKAQNSPFLASVIEHPRYHELSFDTDKWVEFGPFLRAHDFFGDSSFWLLDTPGHMPGHLGGMALTGQNEWVFMGGDCCHHRSLLVGSRPMSVTVGPAGTLCFHRDPEAVKETLSKIRALDKSGNALVALAHDHFLEGVMPEYPQSLNGWSSSSWKEELDLILRRNYSSQD
jgi:glyoxylase-like metal-dependent hydrolase (beta-lactamase superfamily II)